MNRPSGTSPASPPATRQRFLEAGARVFVREGYVGASMELVAKDAGLSRAALYKHFDNKGDLFASVAEMLHQSAADASASLAAARLAEGSTGPEAIIEFMSARHQRFSELLQSSVHATELMEESSRRCGPLIRRHADLFRAALVALIEALAASKRLRLNRGLSAKQLAEMLLAAEAGLKAGDASFLSPGYEAAFNRMARTLISGATQTTQSR